MNKLKEYFKKYKPYVQVDLLMYLFMIVFIIILFVFFA